MPPSKPLAATHVKAGAMASKGKKEKAPEPVLQKSTMLSFFSRAPAAAPAKPSEKEKKKSENAAIVVSDHDEPGSANSDVTPSRPPAPSSTSPGGDKDIATPASDVKKISLQFDETEASSNGDHHSKEDGDCIIVPSNNGSGSDSSKPANAPVSKASNSKAAATPKAAAKAKATATPKAQKQGEAKAEPKPKASNAKADAAKKDVHQAKIEFAKDTDAGANFFKQGGFFKTAEKPADVKRKERPPLPEGHAVNLEDERLLMVAQFLSTFSTVLDTSKITITELHRDLKRNEPSDMLAKIHVALLQSIVKAGDTPDEVSMIDTDTWPEVLREHLEDNHATEYKSLHESLSMQDYSALPFEDRVKTLYVLVDDCLQTPTIRDTVDHSLVLIDQYHREQQIDEIEEKYPKNHDTGLDVFVTETPSQHAHTTVDDSAVAGMTERQRSLIKSREEEARLQRIEQEKRAREARKQEREDQRKAADNLRKRRMEERVEGLVTHGDIVRVQTASITDAAVMYHYLVVDSNSGKRQLLCRTSPAASTAPDATASAYQDVQPATKWTQVGLGSEMDAVMEHWSPVFVENDKQIQRRLREIAPQAEKVPEVVEKKQSGDDKDKVQVISDGSDEEKGDKKQETEHKVEILEDEADEGKEAVREVQKEGEVEEKDVVIMEEGDKKDDAKEEESAEIARSGLDRACEVVRELEERTPDDMFSDIVGWKQNRQAWLEAVSECKDVHSVASRLAAFELALKRTKMQEGWDEVRVKWKLDLDSKKTYAAMMYLSNQLKVYIGRQKPKPGKLAAVFKAPPPRVTRSMDPNCVAARLRQKERAETDTTERVTRASTRTCSNDRDRRHTRRSAVHVDDSSDEGGQEEEEQEASDDGGDSDFQESEDEGSAGRKRGAAKQGGRVHRKSQRSVRNSRSSSFHESRNRPTRRSTRSNKSRSSLAEEASTSGSESD